MIPTKQGKVRDIYNLGDKLVLVATDRISAFDVVLPTLIPDKGKVLNKLSKWWFNHLSLPSQTHFLFPLPEPFFSDPEFKDRSMLVRKTLVIPFECVVRGFLTGSAWNEYKQTGEICGIKLPKGLQENQPLPEPIFTPATKEISGHDINVDFGYMQRCIGSDLAKEIKEKSLKIYSWAAKIVFDKGILIADTKFEFGLYDKNLLLIDEVLTPDSSRFWSVDKYCLNKPVPSLDKQYVRDWLKENPNQPLSDEVVQETRNRYILIYETLTGDKW